MKGMIHMKSNNAKKYNRYGEGSVYQRDSDGRWVTKYKPENSIKPIVRTSKTEKEAKEKLKELKRLEVLKIQTSNQTIENLMETWLETFRQPVLKPQTYDKEESVYLCHIKPTIGEYQCHHVNSMMLQNLVNDKSRQLGHKALSKVFGLLDKFFEYTLNEQMIEKNPMISVSMPKEEHTVQVDNPIYYLEIEEINRIERVVESQVEKARETGKWTNAVARYGYIVLFLINTGLRKGEMLALTWDDLLYNQNRVNVNKNLGRIKNRNRKEADRKNMWHLGTPKSKNSTRLATFNKKARRYMCELKRIQEHLDYVDKKHIARSPDGYPFSNSTWDNLLKKVCKLAKVDKPISPHELRHTYATVCISQGVNVLAVSKRMGHSSIEQTYKYVHLLKDVESEADEILEDLIPDNSVVKDSPTKGLVIKDLIPADLIINGLAIKDLIPKDLVA